MWKRNFQWLVVRVEIFVVVGMNRNRHKTVTLFRRTNLSCFLPKKETEFGHGMLKCHKFTFSTFRVNWFFFIDMAIYFTWG